MLVLWHGVSIINKPNASQQHSIVLYGMVVLLRWWEDNMIVDVDIMIMALGVGNVALVLVQCY
jgi:hypothetical protein